MRFIIDAMTPPHAARAPSIRETREGEDPRPATNVSATKVFRRPKWAALTALTPAAGRLRLHRMRDHLAHHRRQRPFGPAVDRAPARAGREPGQAIGRGGGARHGELAMEMRQSVAHPPLEELPAPRHPRPREPPGPRGP